MGSMRFKVLSSKITKDMLDPGDVEASEIDDGECSSTYLVDSFGSSTLLVLSWCAFGVPLVGLHLAMICCALKLDVVYEDPNRVRRVHKDLLDPGGLVTTAGLVQEEQVKLAKVYLVMGISKADVAFFLLDSMEAWWVLCWALVKFASLGPRSVSTNQCVVRYASDGRLRLVCQWVRTCLHVPAIRMLCGKSQELTLAAMLDVLFRTWGNVA